MSGKWKKKIYPHYDPDPLKIGFRSLLDELNYKMRMDTDPHFAAKRNLKGIHPSEGLIQTPLPLASQSGSVKKLGDSNVMGQLPLAAREPIQHQANAEQAFEQFKVNQGYGVMKQGQGPQTAADSQNLQAAQGHQQVNQNETHSNLHWNPAPFPDPFKKQEQDLMNPFAPPGGAPNSM